MFAGYGFVDFESPSAAEVAVQALQSQGIQAQMAKVGQIKVKYQHASSTLIHVPKSVTIRFELR